MPSGDWTRSAGFYKNHPTVTGQILTDSGGIAVCGRTITDVDPDDCHSALEALCIEVHGDQQRQLVRQLTAAALTTAAGGATFTNFVACDAVCQNPSATKSQLADCIEQTDDFNLSGDSVPSPIDTGGGADHGPCEAAFVTPCWVLDGPSCAVCP
jgi:hypothetical protein